MDQISPDQDSQRVKGVIYNSKKPIGGVYYYDEKTKPVRMQINPQTKEEELIVEIEKKYFLKSKKHLERNLAKIEKIGSDFGVENNELDEETKAKIIAERIAELNEEQDAFQRRLYREKQRKILHIKRLAQKIEDQSDNYTVVIAGKAIDFGKEGIAEANFTTSDKEWLQKAQHYFINAKENGKRIGSAEEYTSKEALEALWATAQQTGIDPKRFLVQIFNETRFNPNAKGASGERGIGQFKKTTAEYYGYDWQTMQSGLDGYAYQAKAAAEFVSKVGEESYNGKGAKARRYKNKITNRVNSIEESPAACNLRNTELCISTNF